MTVTTIDRIGRQELVGRNVLVRIDAEDFRLHQSVPTLRFLSDSGARTIIATHSHADPDLSLLAARLADSLRRAVVMVDDWKAGAGIRVVTHLRDGDIAMIENLALDPHEAAADEKLALALAHLCDIYCNDAFAFSHEIRASTVGVAKKARLAVAGLAFERELGVLEDMRPGHRSPSLAILGGTLSIDKLRLAEEVARRSDRLLLAGQMALPFLVAKGVVKHPAVLEDMVGIAQSMMKEADDAKREIEVPADFTVMARANFDRLVRREHFPLAPPIFNAAQHELESDSVICDIGTTTQWNWSEYFGPARTIFWHGPVGVSEIDPFGDGTRFLAAQLVRRTWPRVHRSLVCGRSLVTGLRRTGFPIERIKHLTPAGRAALHYFAGRPLPAVEVLRKACRQLDEPCRILIPLDGSDGDAHSLRAAMELTPPDAQFFLLHVRLGIDLEDHPDFIAALSEAEKFKRRIESERIFARANAVLASRGFLPAHQMSAQGNSPDVILRAAKRVGAELIILASNRRKAMGAARVVDQAPRATMIAP